MLDIGMHESFLKLLEQGNCLSKDSQRACGKHTVFGFLLYLCFCRLQAIDDWLQVGILWAIELFTAKQWSLSCLLSPVFQLADLA